MCLNIIKELKVTVTSRDLTVYKILQKNGDNYESPIYFTLWNIGTELYINPSDILETIDVYDSEELADVLFSINTGFHAFTKKPTAISQKKQWEKTSSLELVIAEMLIPKGAIVIKGDNHEIVTNKMKLIKIF